MLILVVDVLMAYREMLVCSAKGSKSKCESLILKVPNEGSILCYTLIKLRCVFFISFILVHFFCTCSFCVNQHGDSTIAMHCNFVIYS
jgi:hypothetical protein